MVHTYADDAQVCISTQATEESSAMECLTSCIVKFRDWMATGHLKINEDKTQVMWLGTRYQICKVTAQTLTLPNATVQFSTVVNDVGILINSELTMANHIAALNRSCFLHMRQLRSIRHSLTSKAMLTLIQAFVSNLHHWLHHIWHHTANQHHPALVGLICDPPRLANSTFLARRLTTGREVSLSMDQLSGTADLLNIGHLTSRWTFSKPN